MNIEIANEIKEYLLNKDKDCKIYPDNLIAFTDFVEKDRAEQLNLSGVVGQSEQLPLNKTFFNKARSLSYTEFSKWINTILR